MEGPAPTIQYFIAAYGVIFFGLASYLVSLALRWKKMKEYTNLLRNK